MGESLGDRLKRMRSSKELGLRATASAAGISATYLSRVENNQETSPPSEEKLKKLAEVLGDNFDELMQLAGRVPMDVANMIKADSGMPAFLRRARDKNVSAEELLEMLDKITKQE
ncbi:helix-turn-helix domain-containing protein [Geobacter argillaceus]|uniref:Transcriptional regulator with XRE-family HTH domain n=1 Tax=Geobacter argillaceus TaxID=345631 RepID=A0A562VP76_9BACT|nr:helix-turn-helix transcriptional regulator [Geobacter argillaceus]TWJ19715.1 transcriptional regulator with XRE-family HTH domain [Geobacter argillaceus]